MEAGATNEQAVLKPLCLTFASRIIARWPEQKFRGSRYGDHGDARLADVVDEDPDDDESDADNLKSVDAEHLHHGSDHSPPPVQKDSGVDKDSAHPLLSLLGDLGDAALIASCIRHVLIKDASVHPGKALGDLCQRHGWLTFQDELRELFEQTTNETVERHARLLADFSLRRDESADRKTLCSQLARQLMSAVECWNPRSPANDWRARTVDLQALLPLPTQVFVVLGEQELLERLVDCILERPKQFDLTSVQVPAVLGLEPWLKCNARRPFAPLHRWLAAIVEELESRVSCPPQEPTDWRRQSATGCGCADCAELSRFLTDPQTATLRLPLAESRRRHMHQIIDGKQLDTTHVTERRGRPYTLVCTKTKASYERALKTHHLDRDHLAKMQKLLEWHNSLSTDLTRAENRRSNSRARKRQ